MKYKIHYDIEGDPYWYILTGNMEEIKKQNAKIMKYMNISNVIDSCIKES